MKFLTTVLACFSTLTFAKNIELKIDTTWKNLTEEKQTQKKVIVALEKDFIIEGDDQLKIHLNASEDLSNTPVKITEGKGVLLTGRIYDFSSGDEKLISSPQIITKIGNEATFTQEGQGQFLEMKITPVRIVEEANNPPARYRRTYEKAI